MVRVYVRCKTCRIWFNIGKEFDVFDPNLPALSGGVHSCPLGHSHEYSRSDYASEANFQGKTKRIAGRPYNV